LFFKARSSKRRKTWCHADAGIPRFSTFFPLITGFRTLRSWGPLFHEVAMFFRVKPSGPRRYLQLVENFWDGGRTKQRVLCTLGRLDHLQDSGQLDAFLASGARFSQKVLLLTAHQNGQAPVVTTRRIGPPLIFERLWQETGCRDVLRELLADRRFEFAGERAVFLTVFHRLCATGSARAADRWKHDYALDGANGLQLHHHSRAMA